LYHRPRMDERRGELWELAEPDLDLTVVVPYYNPGPRLCPNVEQLVEVLASAGVSFEVITVSDGSTDGSTEAMAALAHAAVRRVTLNRNWGKGQALRVGLAMGRGRYLGFIDADGDVAPDVLAPLASIMRAYQPDIILGSKRHPMSVVDYPALRRFYSWGYQQLIRVLFRLRVRDTQTGVKLVRREVLAAVLPRMVEKGFAFDLELFVVARHLGYQRLFEAPVRLGERFTSTISSAAVLHMLVDTLAIWRRLRAGVYDEVPGPSKDGTAGAGEAGAGGAGGPRSAGHGPGRRVMGAGSGRPGRIRLTQVRRCRGTPGANQ